MTRSVGGSFQPLRAIANRLCPIGGGDRRLQSPQPRNDPAIVEAHLGTAESLSAHHAPSGEPGCYAHRIEIVQFLDAESSGVQRALELGAGVATIVLEGGVEGAINRGNRRDQKQQRAARDQSLAGCTQKLHRLLDVLEHVHRDHAIRRKAATHILQVAVLDADPAIAGETTPQPTNVVSGGLDQKHLFRRRLSEDQLGNRPDASSGFHDSLPQRGGERIDYPAVVVGGLGDRVKLGPGIRKIGDGGVGKRLGESSMRAGRQKSWPRANENSAAVGCEKRSVRDAPFSRPWISRLAASVRIVVDAG